MKNHVLMNHSEDHKIDSFFIQLAGFGIFWLFLQYFGGKIVRICVQESNQCSFHKNV